MNFLREKTAGLNLRETTARLSQSASEWREKLQATSGTFSTSLELKSGKKDDPDGGDIKLDSISLVDNRTDEENLKGEGNSGSGPSTKQHDSTHQTGKDTSVFTSVATLIEAAKAQKEQYFLDIADPEVVKTMQQIQALKNNLKTLRQTNRGLTQDRNKDLGIIMQQKNAVGRDLWLKTQNNKLNPYVLKDYREELLKLSLPEHDISNPTLTAETKLLRAQHNEWITGRQMAIVHKLQQSIIDYMYNDALPRMKEENEVAIKAVQDEVVKMKEMKDEVGKLYQRRTQIQEAILAKYTEQVLTEMSVKSSQLSGWEAKTSDQDFQECDSDFSLLPRKGKNERSLTHKTVSSKSAAMGENDGKSERPQNESTFSVVDVDLQSLPESKTDFSTMSHNLALSNGVSNLEEPSLTRSPELAPRTGMAARIAERRRASTQQQQSDAEKVGQDNQLSTASIDTVGETKPRDEQPGDRSDTSASNTKDEDGSDPQSQNDGIQGSESRRATSMTDRRPTGGRIGATGRGSRSGLLERARSARLQGASVQDGKDASGGGAKPDDTSGAAPTHNSTISSRPTVARNGSISTGDVGGSSRRLVRPSLSSSSTNDFRPNSRRNLTSGLSSRQLNGNEDGTSSVLSEERRTEIRNQLRNTTSNDNADIVSNGVKDETMPSITSRPSMTKTPSRQFERVTDESDEES